MPLYDLHTHSLWSFDSAATIPEIYASAKEKGLNGLALTQHADLYPSVTRDDPVLIKAIDLARLDLEAARKDHPDIDFLWGVELGQALHQPDVADAIMKEPFDVVLGSVHNCINKQDFYYLEYTKDNIVPQVSLYFSEILDLVKTDYFDVLAHLTYPFRYIARAGLPVDDSPFMPMIREILGELIESGRALEVNTAGYRQPIRETSPSQHIIGLYRQMGGRKITIGSDAHRACDLGAHFDITCRMLREIGFESYFIYKQREPIELPLPY